MNHSRAITLAMSIGLSIALSYSAHTQNADRPASLITGVDGEALTKTIGLEVERRYVTRAGVTYVQKEAPFSVTIGVFPSVQAARKIADWCVKRVPVPPEPISERIGDVLAWWGGGTVMLIRENVVCYIKHNSVAGALSTAKSIDRLLTTSDVVAPKAHQVPVPVIRLEVPGQVSVGERVVVRYSVEGDEKVLVGTASAKPRQSGRLPLLGPRTEPGTYTLNLFFATETNVIINKSVSVQVVAQE